MYWPRGVALGEGGLTHGYRTTKGSVLTIKQVLTALLEQAAGVEWNEELCSKRIAIQVTGQRKGTLQNRDQQKAAGSGFAMPTLDLVESTETESSPSEFRQEKILPRERGRHCGGILLTGVFIYSCSLAPNWSWSGNSTV